MTKAAHIKYAAQGILTILLALFLIIYEESALPIVVAIIAFGLTLKGLRSLVYYFSMARSMVGGRAQLYRGLIFTDLGVFSASLAAKSGIILILYIAAMNLFSGLISILRAMESKKIGSPQWKAAMVYGCACVIMAAAVLVFGIALKKPAAAVYVYAAGLIYSAIIMIASAFRRTAIVYIP